MTFHDVIRMGVGAVQGMVPSMPTPNLQRALVGVVEQLEHLHALADAMKSELDRREAESPGEAMH